jgi:DegV family protein with EDD domain
MNGATTMTVRIVTDSTAEVPADVAADLGITIIPMVLMFGDEELQDGVDIQSEGFFKRLPRDPHHPTTTQPAPGIFKAAYEKLIAEGATQIVSIHVSGKLSGTCGSARQAAEGLPVTVVDSLTVSAPLGFAAIEAAKAAKAGATAEQAAAVAQDVIRRSCIYVTLETMEYLRKGGRLSRGQELIGGLLKVKPILQVLDGEVQAVGRIRTKSKALEEIINRVSETRPWQFAFVIHASTQEEIDYVSSRLAALSEDTPLMTNRMTPVIGVHLGPGGIGLGAISAPDDKSPDFLPK